MIRSMTAYASAETEIDGDLYGWEIRAVNHRYLDINLRIPEHLRKLESDFRASINRQLNRGKIDCVLNVRRQSGMQDDLHLDRQQLESLIRTVHEVESEMGNPAACSALEILAWPGILNERKGDPEVLKDPLGDLLMTAISTLIECREREGSQLAGLILDRCRLLTQQVEAVRLRLPSIAEKFRSRLQSRIADIAAEIDPVRFEQEISFLLQKMDVEEEMERLA
ncbi:MAG: YicC family protein, partial [Gammaproteobacteria bacterium]